MPTEFSTPIDDDKDVTTVDAQPVSPQDSYGCLPEVQPESADILHEPSVHPTTRSRVETSATPVIYEHSGRDPLQEGKAPKAIGVRLCMVGQTFVASCTEPDVRKGVSVVINLEQGQALGEVVSVYYDDIPEDGDDSGLDGEFVRYATAKDIAIHTENSLQAAEASAFCKTCIRQRSLDMKLVDVVVLHDKSKIIFFFTAPSRIDFRELVKDLVACYRTRIELRQIGVRHETQMLGGIGSCGEVCCCRRYLRKFAPVTIKMAKDQNLFLNPSKLSGLCGRLLCCLSFEQNCYEAFNAKTPRIGKKYVTDSGVMRVIRSSMFSESVTCLPEAGDEETFSLQEWEDLHPRRQEHAENRHSEDAIADDLAALEDGKADDSARPKKRHNNKPPMLKDKGGKNKRKRSPH